jgi:hypothetical protein
MCSEEVEPVLLTSPIIVDYIILGDNEKANLREQVKEYLRKGWTVQGGLTNDVWSYYQAMVKYE